METPYARCPYCLSIIGKYDKDDKIIALSEDEITELKSLGLYFWTNDPILTHHGAVFDWDRDPDPDEDDESPILIITDPKDVPNYTRQYIGFNLMIDTHIKELQDARTTQEIAVGIEEEDRTVFSSVVSEDEGGLGYFVPNKVHILELRESTEKILNMIGLEKQVYFNYTEEYQNIKRYNADDNLINQLTWYDPHEIDEETEKLSWSYAGHPKNIHIEDLRHPLSLVWIEKFEKASKIDGVGKTILNYSQTWLNDQRVDASRQTMHIFPDKDNITFTATDRNYWAYRGAVDQYSTSGANIDAGQRTTATASGTIEITSDEKYKIKLHRDWTQTYPDPSFRGLHKYMTEDGGDVLYYSRFNDFDASYYPEDLENNLVIWNNGFYINKNTRFSFDIDITTLSSSFSSDERGSSAYPLKPYFSPNTSSTWTRQYPTQASIIIDVFTTTPKGNVRFSYKLSDAFPGGYTESESALQTYFINDVWFYILQSGGLTVQRWFSLIDFTSFNRNLYNDILEVGTKLGLVEEDMFDDDGKPTCFVTTITISGVSNMYVGRFWETSISASADIDVTIDNMKLYYGLPPAK